MLSRSLLFVILVISILDIDAQPIQFQIDAQQQQDVNEQRGDGSVS